MYNTYIINFKQVSNVEKRFSVEQSLANDDDMNAALARAPEKDGDNVIQKRVQVQNFLNTCIGRYEQITDKITADSKMALELHAKAIGGQNEETKALLDSMLMQYNTSKEEFAGFIGSSKAQVLLKQQDIKDAANCTSLQLILDGMKEEVKTLTTHAAPKNYRLNCRQTKATFLKTVMGDAVKKQNAKNEDLPVEEDHSALDIAAFCTSEQPEHNVSASILEAKLGHRPAKLSFQDANRALEKIEANALVKTLGKEMKAHLKHQQGVVSRPVPEDRKTKALQTVLRGFFSADCFTQFPLPKMEDGAWAQKVYAVQGLKARKNYCLVGCTPFCAMELRYVFRLELCTLAVPTSPSFLLI